MLLSDVTKSFPVTSTLGARLQSIRKEAGERVDDVAAIMGVSATQWRSWEAKVKPNVDSLTKMHNLLGLDLNTLFKFGQDNDLERDADAYNEVSAAISETDRDTLNYAIKALLMRPPAFRKGFAKELLVRQKGLKVGSKIQQITEAWRAEITPESFGERFLMLRRSAGLTQGELATISSATNASYLSTVESNSKKPSSDYLSRLSEFNINFNWLIAGVGKIEAVSVDVAAVKANWNLSLSSRGIAGAEATGAALEDKIRLALARRGMTFDDVARDFFYKTSTVEKVARGGAQSAGLQRVLSALTGYKLQELWPNFADDVN